MSGVADGHAMRGRKEGGHQRGGKRSLFRKFGKLLIEQADKFGLVQTIDETAHERAQVRGRGGDGVAVARDVGQQQAGDASGGATGSVVNVAAALRFSVRLAENRGIESTERHAARSELAATPDFHALHVLFRVVTHDRSCRPTVAFF